MALQNPVIQCPACSRQYPREEYPWRCECGEPYILDGTAEIRLEELPASSYGFWRFIEVYPLMGVPLELDVINSFTKLSPMEMDSGKVLLKLEYQLPGGSFKDRGAAIMAAHAHELGVTEVVEDTSGNAGVALSYYASLVGIACHIYSTTILNAVKENKIIERGAELHKISNDRQAVTDETLNQVSRKYYASHIYNPYFFHGVKSAAYELFEQLDGKIPDTVVVPVGHGTLILGMALGFNELKSMGYAESIPKFIGVQASACCPIVSDYSGGETSSSGEKNIAEGIDVSKPPRINQILSVVKDSGGMMLAVSNEEIYAEMGLRESLGVNVEPTSLVAVAGARRYVKNADPDETIIVPITGANH